MNKLTAATGPDSTRSLLFASLVMPGAARRNWADVFADDTMQHRLASPVQSLLKSLKPSQASALLVGGGIA
jgi:hypothetical protein